MQRTILAALVASLFSTPIHALELPVLGEIVVTATRIPMPDMVAPYASEVHTREMIEASGAATLYDYLGQHASVQVLPSYGNRFTPKIDMRGYGIGDGYQNIAISLDGRRLNNIDGVAQLLGAIPLTDIERIEITKGSGSVMFGDGATAGSIQIVTRSREGVALGASLGSQGARSVTVSAGLNKSSLGMNVSADYQSDDGHSAPDPNGYTDASISRNWRGGVAYRPSAGVTLGLDASSSRIDARYVNYLTLAEFQTDPGQVGNNPYSIPENLYNRQRLASDTWRVQAGLPRVRGWQLEFSHGHEDKSSEYSAFWRPTYDYDTDDLALRYEDGPLAMTAGWQRFGGMRLGGGDRTGKGNTGWYLHGQYRTDERTFSVGARRERVAYDYAPMAGPALGAEHALHAWDVGYNQQLSGGLSWFANANRAFQAPDIDRFFVYDFGASSYAFNGFIRPAISRTLNLGVNHLSARHRLKFTLFHAWLDDEIYLLLPDYKNTNLDKTRKYGLEVQDAWRIADGLDASINYTYTRAKIDHEDDGGGAYDGKDLPGVPRHGLVLGLTCAPDGHSSLGLTHTWRSRTWAAEDFANAFSQRQASYQSTDVVYRRSHGQFEWSIALENLFARENGLWIRDDVIYPVNFARTWRLGMKASF